VAHSPHSARGRRRAAGSALKGANTQPWHVVAACDPAPFGTDTNDPFLETGPRLLIAAPHHARLATLTHTPSPMGYLNRILRRPEGERPVMLPAQGYPAADAGGPGNGPGALLVPQRLDGVQPCRALRRQHPEHDSDQDGHDHGDGRNAEGGGRADPE